MTHDCLTLAEPGQAPVAGDWPALASGGEVVLEPYEHAIRRFQARALELRRDDDSGSFRLEGITLNCRLTSQRFLLTSRKLRAARISGDLRVLPLSGLKPVGRLWPRSRGPSLVGQIRLDHLHALYYQARPGSESEANLLRVAYLDGTTGSAEPVSVQLSLFCRHEDVHDLATLILAASLARRLARPGLLSNVERHQIMAGLQPPGLERCSTGSVELPGAKAVRTPEGRTGLCHPVPKPPAPLPRS
jgi:hypothetical protein